MIYDDMTKNKNIDDKFYFITKGCPPLYIYICFIYYFFFFFLNINLAIQDATKRVIQFSNWIWDLSIMSRMTWWKEKKCVNVSVSVMWEKAQLIFLLYIYSFTKLFF